LHPNAPSASIAAPTRGNVSGAVNVNATDYVGLARVDLKANGEAATSDTTAPWGSVWNSASAVDGPISLAAVDAAGNSGASSPASNPV
jgi:thermitase